MLVAVCGCYHIVLWKDARRGGVLAAASNTNNIIVREDAEVGGPPASPANDSRSIGTIPTDQFPRSHQGHVGQIRLEESKLL